MFKNGVVFELAPVNFQALSKDSNSLYSALSVPLVSQTGRSVLSIKIFAEIMPLSRRPGGNFFALLQVDAL